MESEKEEDSFEKSPIFPQSFPSPASWIVSASNHCREFLLHFRHAPAAAGWKQMDEGAS